MAEKRLNRQSRLLNHTFQRSGLDGFVLRNNDGPRFLAKNGMRAPLPHDDKTKTPQRLDHLGAGEVAWKLHAAALRATTGSSAK